MKNKSVFILSVATLLALGACNGGNNKNKNQEGLDPEVDLSDIAKANSNIEFDEITKTCMINDKAQTYIDAMEEQEKTLEKPYHFSSLYGPDDYAKIAAASDKGDGTTYADEDTGGVDVCQILNRNDYSNDCKNYPIQLTWDDDGTFENATVKFWSTEDQSDVRETKVSVKNGKVVAELANLYRARKYRAQVFNDGDVSQSVEFKTGDYPRTITMGGVHNVRDIGGYPTSYGVRTNQGLMYRGYYIDDKSGGHGVNYSAAVQEVQEEVMQIGYEIDLQKSSETNGRTASALNSEATPCDYKCLTLISYDNFLTQDSYKNLPEVMHIMAQSDEKHTYFHCWGGADRTGMLAFFINAILGVSYTDLIEDLELTTQTNNKRCHMHNSSSAHYPKFINAFHNWSGFDSEKTVNENCEKWLIEVAQVAEEDIERIREIMLPGYESGKLQKDKLIPSYTASEGWVVDKLAGWQPAKEDANVKCNWHRHKGTPCSICNNGGGSVTPTPSSSQPSGEVNYLEPLARVWKEGTPANNSDGKQYIPLSEEATGKVGVKIKFADYSDDSTGTVSDGKIGPVNDETAHLTYRLKAPKAGVYQLVMSGRVSDASKTLDKRKLRITLNGTNVDIQGADRDGGLKADGDNDFVAAPALNLTGNEDVITVTCCDNRIAFVASSYLVFIEH